MKEALAKKELGPPEIGAMSYMMSKQQYLGDRNGHWRPHLMFYVPGETNAAAWGANLPSSPVFGGGQDLPGGGRLPWTIFFVPVPRWSDGAPAKSARGRRSTRPTPGGPAVPSGGADGRSRPSRRSSGG